MPQAIPAERPDQVVEAVTTVTQSKPVTQSKQPKKIKRWSPKSPKLKPGQGIEKWKNWALSLKPLQDDVDWQKIAREENASQPKPRQDYVDWKRVAREENAYLRKARGLTYSPKVIRGGGCSPR
jgi:hypothetical protein